MEPKVGNASKPGLSGLYVGAFCFVWSCSTTAQGFSDNISQLAGSASVFTGVSHTRTDLANDTEPSIGLSGRLGGTLESGANSLVLQYGGTLENSQDTAGIDGSDNSYISGAARYTYFDPASRLDFNLGHSVRSVRGSSGFNVNQSGYDTQQTLNGGAGLSFYPGELTTLRFSGRAGQSFGDGSVDDQESYTVGSDLSRRLSERSTGGINVSRSWSDERDTDVTIDTAQLVYSLQTENGYLSVGAGGSKADTEYAGGTSSESEAITGFAERAWVDSSSRTALKYNRSMSDSATDLSLNLPPEFSLLPDSIRLRDLVVKDSLLLSHNSQKVCDSCDLGVYVEGAVLESQVTDETSHEYRAGVNLGLQLTALQRLNFGYRWEGDADRSASNIIDQIHRLNTSWMRNIAENTTFGVEFNQAFRRSGSARGNQEEYELLLVLRHGFSLTGAAR